MKKIAVMFFIAVFALAALSGMAQAQEKKYVAKLADILSPDHPHTRSWVYFADKVKEKTKVVLTVQFPFDYPRGCEYFGVDIHPVEKGSTQFRS